MLTTSVNLCSENAEMEHARSKGDTGQATDFCWGFAQVRYDGTRLRKQLSPRICSSANVIVRTLFSSRSKYSTVKL